MEIDQTVNEVLQRLWYWSLDLEMKMEDRDGRTIPIPTWLPSPDLRHCSSFHTAPYGGDILGRVSALSPCPRREVKSDFSSRRAGTHLSTFCLTLSSSFAPTPYRGGKSGFGTRVSGSHVSTADTAAPASPDLRLLA
jgi:hypothetical protein